MQFFVFETWSAEDMKWHNVEHGAEMRCNEKVNVTALTIQQAPELSKHCASIFKLLNLFRKTEETRSFL